MKAEAGDGWDVDDAVKAAFAKKAAQGDLSILVVEEADARDAAALTRAADAFLGKLPGAGAGPAKKKPTGKKPPPVPKKPVAKAAKKPARK